jgi:hypothetical protein
MPRRMCLKPGEFPWGKFCRMKDRAKVQEWRVAHWKEGRYHLWYRHCVTERNRVIWARLWRASTALSVSHCAASTGRAGVIPQSLQLHTQITLGDVTSRKSARRCVQVDQCVSAVGVVELPVFFCIRKRKGKVHPGTGHEDPEVE